MISAAVMSPAWAASHQGSHGTHGDKIKFKAISDSGKFTVTEIAPDKGL